MISKTTPQHSEMDILYMCPYLSKPMHLYALIHEVVVLVGYIISEYVNLCKYLNAENIMIYFWNMNI